MKPRERVLCAIDHKEPDTVPITEFVYSRPFYKEVLGSVPEAYTAEYIMGCAQKVGYDAVFIPFGGFGSFEYHAEGSYKDEWGTTYQKEEAAWPSDAPVGFPIKDMADWQNYTMPDPSVPSRTDNLKTAVRMNAEAQKFVFGTVRGPLSGSWLLTGFSEMCIKMYEEPELVRGILDRVTDFYIAGGLRMLQDGADALLIADDYGSNTAPFLSPEMFGAFILPRLQRMLDAFHAAGSKVFLHSDGRVAPFLPMLAAVGIDGLHPMERAAGMDIAAIKQEYGQGICLMGNVNNKTTLVTGTPGDVHAEVRECIAAAAAGGGYILASDHSVHDDTPIENIFAMVEAGRRYGKYPIQMD